VIHSKREMIVEPSESAANQFIKFVVNSQCIDI